MLILTNAGTDKLSLTRSAAQSIDVHASYMDCSTASPPVVDVPGRTNTNFATAATGDIVATPGASKVRNVKTLHIRNKGSASCDVTVNFDQNGTLYELHKVTLQPGYMLEYVEGVGFFTVTDTSKLDAKLRVTTDVTFTGAGTWADITGLTTGVKSGKQYNFEAHIFHIENAATTGARFGINGPSMTAIRLNGFSVFAGSLTAATFNSATADVAAVDTSVLGVTTSSAGTPQVAHAIMAGWINPSADGTFACRAASEVAVAAGVTVKAGSWCRIWESDN